MIGLIVAFLTGAAFTLLLVVAGALAWFNSQPQVASWKPKETGFEPFIRPQLPQHLRELCAEVNQSNPDEATIRKETCNWFNIIAQFLFRELRDSTKVKRWVIKKINKEFEEFMLTKTEGRMVEQLIARDYSMGTSLPIIVDATVERIQCAPEDEHDPVEVDIALKVEYTGQCRLEIDVDLVFNKAAYVAITVVSVKGRGRLQFSRTPYTHYSFAFYEDPEMEMQVESNFEGRKVPQLSSFIENQLRKWVRRKHTLPHYKRRFKPFFEKFKPQNQLLDVHVHNNRLTVGKLEVEIVDCSRLVEIEGGEKLYCTVGVDSMPWDPVLYLWRTKWPLSEYVVEKQTGVTIGIKYKAVVHDDKPVRSLLVMVSQVIHPSAASVAGVRIGDILTKVNNVRVSSVKQAERIIQKSKKSVLLIVQRPPSRISKRLLNDKSLSSSSSGKSSSSRRRDSKGTSSSRVRTSHTGNAASGSTSRTSTTSIQISGSDASGRGQGSDDFDGLLNELTPLAGVEEEECPEIGVVASSEDDLSPLPSFPRAQGGDGDTISLCGVSGERGMSDRGEGGGVQDGEGHLTVRRRRRARTLTDANRTTTSASSILDDSYDHSQLLNSLEARSDLSPSPTPPRDEVDGGSTEVGGASRGTHSSNSNRLSSRRQNPNQKKTKDVAMCMNPLWNESFKFSVSERHHYLNVCVWSKLHEEDNDILIGYVTISLMDIAVECLCTGAGTHHQRYVLVATEPSKAAASRAVLQATSSQAYGGTSGSGKGGNKKDKDKEKDKVFVGEMLLRFKHKMSATDRDKKTSSKERGEEKENETLPQGPQTIGEHHPFTVSEENNPRNHHFIGVEVDGTQKCEICHKKIWALKSRVQECEKCFLKCHKKCVTYCLVKVPCIRRQNVNLDHLRQSSDGDFAVYSGEDDGREPPNRAERAPSNHRSLDQRQITRPSESRHRSNRSSSFEVVEYDIEEEGEQEESEGVATAREVMVSQQTDREEELGESGDKDVNTNVKDSELLGMCGEEEKEEDGSSESEELLTPESGSDIDNDLLEQRKALQEFSWYGHMPIQERETALKRKVSSLQTEIDRFNELINDALSDLRDPINSPTDRERIQNTVDQYEVKLEPLKLLMMQLLLELDNCEHPG